jgi:hypothetical protein
VWVKDEGAMEICFCISFQPTLAYVNQPKTILPRRGYQAIIINDIPVTRSG